MPGEAAKAVQEPRQAVTAGYRALITRIESDNARMRDQVLAARR